MNFNPIFQMLLVGSLAVAFACSILTTGTFAQVDHSKAQSGQSAKAVAIAKPDWEYHVAHIIYNSSDLESKLNQLGSEGWELVHIQGDLPAIFRRRKQIDPASPSQRQSENPRIEVLEKERIELLEKRVDEMKKLLDGAHISINEFTQSEIDLIQAKLACTMQPYDELDLLNELVKKYDLLIEAAEFNLQVPPDRKSPTESAELLWLQSERIRIKIRIENTE